MEVLVRPAPRNHSEVAGRWHVNQATVMEPNGPT